MRSSPAELSDRFMERCARFAALTAVVYANERISYHELAGRVGELARQWNLVGTPQRILLVEPDPLRLLIAILTCWRLGASAIPLRPQAPADVSRNVVDILQPSHRYGASVQADALQPVIDGPRDCSPPHNEECLVILTSGTTGQPKLAALPARGIALSAEAIAADLEFSGDDRILVTTPLTYCYGLVGGVMAGLWAGAEIHLVPHSTVPTVLQNHLRRNGITVVQGPPSLHRLHQSYWNGKPFTKVRLVTQGGEACERNLADWLIQAYPNARRVQIFGMTEASPRISHLDMDDPRALDGCIGLPFSHIRWHLEDTESGTSGPTGRLCLAGPSIFLGYPQGDGGYAGLDPDGYFRTNDLASVDESGFLFYRARADRSFKSGGRLMNPEIVEVALKNMDGVRDAVCRASPHQILGAVPVAEVVPESGAHLREGALLEACSQVLEDFQVPRKITLVPGLDLGPSGKRALSR